MFIIIDEIMFIKINEILLFYWFENIEFDLQNSVTLSSILKIFQLNLKMIEIRLHRLQCVVGKQ